MDERGDPTLSQRESVRTTSDVDSRIRLENERETHLWQRSLGRFQTQHLVQQVDKVAQQPHFVVLHLASRAGWHQSSSEIGWRFRRDLSRSDRVLIIPRKRSKRRLLAHSPAGKRGWKSEK